MVRRQRACYSQPRLYELRGALTLVELLVVIAIIGVLVAILLPALSAARKSATATRCGTQLRELCRGLTLYAHDFDDTLLPSRSYSFAGSDNLYWVGNGYKLRPRWYATLGAGVQIYAYDVPRTDGVHQQIDNPLLICPQVPEWKSEKNASYGYNFQFLGNARKKLDADEFINFPVKYNRVVGNTVVMADSLGTAAHYAPGMRTPNRPDGTTETQSLGFHGFMLDPPRLTSASDSCDNDNPGIRGGPDARHGGQANFGYADGHVDAQRPEAVGYAFEEDGRYVYDGSRVHNGFFSGVGRDIDPPSRTRN